MTNVNDSFAALADPTRRQVLEVLLAGPRPVTELAKDLPVSRSAVSQHLRVLSEAGLVRSERQGRHNFYQVDPAQLAALRSYFDDMWTRALAAYAQAVEAQYAKESRDD
ncbi:metalloregulator ArsR/SmtB family transcription factor [Thalassovita sp.]|uniref:ArsR/SmtB family transcription factor n=1 Tax=Thalassovita sp. TaxID=1979401 RepID=UPI002AB2DB38|nr:metalloregulator ArsR/SmtB family transcription factor [Thalassovita sp.]